MKDYIAQMDKIYAATLDDPPTVGQCRDIVATMETIAARCIKALERGGLNGELQMRVMKLRRMALAEIDAAKNENRDVLTHWVAMRDILTNVPAA